MFADPPPVNSNRAFNLQENVRVAGHMQNWRDAAEVFRTTSGNALQTPDPASGIQTLDDLLKENFGLSQDMLVLSPKKRSWRPGREMGDTDNSPQQTEQVPESTEYHLFRVQSRRNVRQVSGNPSPDSTGSAEAVESSSSTNEDVDDGGSVTAPPVNIAQRLGSKRNRILEQVRQTAAVAQARSAEEVLDQPQQIAVSAQARSVAEQKKVANEESIKTKQSGLQPEAQAPQQIEQKRKEKASMWARFFKL